ncbi:hypothetical protein KDH_72250 [Dictyobacter sp. S3.2.2.5]|uniref:Uncharacterized protein n=1 Tax=Dictyobacter halimunensis TaxID=3026934 RepID=A0ABQ6G5M8_9CHLR|nr:hypothetical protein KDH_72250 [Dictyobacter sp. S3.2.2.5]
MMSNSNDQLNDRLDEEIRRGKYVEEALKRNADISSPVHEVEPPAPLTENDTPENAEAERPVQQIQPRENEPRGEQEQPATAVTDTAQDDLQAAQRQDDQRGQRRDGQINLGDLSNRDGSQEAQREQGSSTGGMNISSGTTDTGRTSPTHAGEANSRERGSANTSDMDQMGGEPPAGGSDRA